MANEMLFKVGRIGVLMLQQSLHETVVKMPAAVRKPPGQL